MIKPAASNKNNIFRTSLVDFDVKLKSDTRKTIFTRMKDTNEHMCIKIL